ncbi:protein FAM193B isoform X1 [Hippocampus zosterae]|uniref:protein FAM193B isoform X1 n=1 Tax=Hippocampus zosterae TaxID=109293 RepID=UPI00223D400A|nr:protein FAM193B isoform X1 [Hippocampus zosterae]
MARKKSKQQGVAQKELVPGQQTAPKNAVSPGDATGGGGDAGVERLTIRANQLMHTCCLLCHREFKDLEANVVNGLPGAHGTKLADAVPALSQALLREAPGRKLADSVPSLSQSLLGEVPLWICQGCYKSVEEEERRSALEQPTGVPLSHSSSCKFQGCGNGYPEQSTVDWDPSSFLSAHKLSGLWNSAHSNGGEHCSHNASLHLQQGITTGSTCHEKRGLHEAPGKSAKTSVAKVCPYSHPLTQNSSGSTAGTPLSTSADLCKTTPKHFKNVCRRPTPPGEAFHTSDHHQHTDLSVPPNSPTGLSSQHSSLLPPKPNSGQHNHITSSSATSVAGHTPFSPLVPNLHGSTTKRASPSPDSPTLVHKPSPCKKSHIPAVNTQHGKSGTSLAGCNHPCNGHSTGTVASTNVGSLSTGACRDQACKGHKMTNGTMCEPSLELEEVEDEDSSSERSSCASSSTNQKDGKYCDCCYCEFFGHNAPPAAPTSRNYAEIREKLRSRLTRRKEELPQRQDSELTVSGAIDNRDVDELLDFINSSEPKPVNSAKAAKRARHKQKKKEKALQGNVGAAGIEPVSNPSECMDEPMPDTAETSRLLDWPQLELERVNSFLTSRLEEIKNTIKDSIRASFSMYDLNLDVNDFPKKAATLEGNHLLSHLNGSSDMQQIDLDLAPLSLGTFKNHLDLVNGWEDTNKSSNTASTATGITAGSKDIQRLNTTPSLSKLIRVRSPEKSTSDNLPQVPSEVTVKTKEDISDPKNSTVGNGGTKSKKSKKQQQQQKQEQSCFEHNPKVTDSRVAEIICNGSKATLKQLQQGADGQKNGMKKAEDSRSSRNAAANGANVAPPNAHKVKGDSDVRAGREREQDTESKTLHALPANGQHQAQSKGKNKKNKSKGEKSASAIDDVFLPKDVDPTSMDEIDREVEYFKRFCLDSAKQTRQKVAVNWSNFSLKKVPSNAAQ